jgi:hypothetical protein
MLALPLECNLTGTRCADSTLDELCDGKVLFQHGPSEVRGAQCMLTSTAAVREG